MDVIKTIIGSAVMFLFLDDCWMLVNVRQQSEPVPAVLLSRLLIPDSPCCLDMFFIWKFCIPFFEVFLFSSRLVVWTLDHRYRLVRPARIRICSIALYIRSYNCSRKGPVTSNGGTGVPS